MGDFMDRYFMGGTAGPYFEPRRDPEVPSVAVMQDVVAELAVRLDRHPVYAQIRKEIVEAQDAGMERMAMPFGDTSGLRNELQQAEQTYRSQERAKEEVKSLLDTIQALYLVDTEAAASITKSLFGKRLGDLKSEDGLAQDSLKGPLHSEEVVYG